MDSLFTGKVEQLALGGRWAAAAAALASAERAAAAVPVRGIACAHSSEPFAGKLPWFTGNTGRFAYR